MNNGVGTLEFHPELWAEPAALLQQLKDRHFRVVSHEYPVISPKSSNFREAEQRGYLVDYTGSESSVMFNEGQRYLDFTNPAVGSWWWEMHRPLVDLGVDGWWLDGGEGPPASVQLHAGSGQALHNTFDFNRQQAFADGERHSRPGQRSWLLCRSGYAGMQRLGAACWSGDISNTFGVFANQLPLGLSTALSGVPYWGTDIGGFFHTVPSRPSSLRAGSSSRRSVRSSDRTAAASGRAAGANTCPGRMARQSKRSVGHLPSCAIASCRTPIHSPGKRIETALH